MPSFRFNQMFKYLKLDNLVPATCIAWLASLCVPCFICIYLCVSRCICIVLVLLLVKLATLTMRDACDFHSDM